MFLKDRSPPLSHLLPDSKGRVLDGPRWTMRFGHNDRIPFLGERSLSPLSALAFSLLESVLLMLMLYDS